MIAPRRLRCGRERTTPFVCKQNAQGEPHENVVRPVPLFVERMFGRSDARRLRRIATRVRIAAAQRAHRWLERRSRGLPALFGSLAAMRPGHPHSGDRSARLGALDDTPSLRGRALHPEGQPASGAIGLRTFHGEPVQTDRDGSLHCRQEDLDNYLTADRRGVTMRRSASAMARSRDIPAPPPLRSAAMAVR